MTYQQTLDYLFSQLPMFQRVGAVAMKKDLTNISALCERLGNPYQKYPTIHIAGTNGKGSSTHILAAVLQQKGKKVGVYTSPHYMDFRERIKINGELAPKEFVVEFVQQYKDVFEEIRPSFFEITVAMAFQYFAEQQVDIAIIETGLGGRLDSTNIITPILSLITNISLDHQSFLGDTLPEIAGEKAGVIKPNIPVVISEENGETAPVFIQKAKEQDASIYFSKDTYEVRFVQEELIHTLMDIYQNGALWIREVKTDIIGAFQAENFRGVVQAIAVLNEQGFEIEKEDIQRAFASIKTTTYFLGRMQVLGEQPLIIADSGHNEGALSKTMKELQAKNFRQLHIVLGFAKDKDVLHALEYFPKNAQYYFTNANIPRAMPATELLAFGESQDLQGNAYASVPLAYEAAQAAAQKEDCIFIGGSIFIVAEILPAN